MIYGIVFFWYNLLYCLGCLSFFVLLLWFMLLFSIRCCSPVFGINPIEFACIIMWAVRWERSYRLVVWDHANIFPDLLLFMAFPDHSPWTYIAKSPCELKLIPRFTLLVKSASHLYSKSLHGRKLHHRLVYKKPLVKTPTLWSTFT